MYDVPNFNPIIPNDGVKGFTDILIWTLRNGGRNCRIHLYSNDYYPDPLSVLGSFTESVFGGYGPQITGNPTDYGLDVDRRDIWKFPETVWTATGSGLPIITYGYWVDFINPLTGLTAVLQAQRFFVPQTLFAAGQTVKFTLSWGGKQC